MIALRLTLGEDFVTIYQLTALNSPVPPLLPRESPPQNRIFFSTSGTQSQSSAECAGDARADFCIFSLSASVFCAESGSE